MNIDELRAAQTRERTTDGLQELRDSFYREVAEYIEARRERRQRAAGEAADPFGSDEVQSLTDEIETAEQVAGAIYERRMGKVVKQASLAAAGMGGDVDGLTDEERSLYADLVSRIERNKSRVLDVLAGEAEAPADVVPEATDPAEVVNDRGTDDPRADRAADTDGEADSSSATAAAAMGGDGDLRGDDGLGTPTNETAGTDADADEEATVERETVRITRDVGEILGVDERAYTLAADDVVTLPVENAAPLLARDAAEKLE